MESEASKSRAIAYTSPRPDVFAMVPPEALRILDVGCSNGALGRSLLAAIEGRTVEGIEGDPQLFSEAQQHLSRVIFADLNSFAWENHFDRDYFDCMIFADVLEHLIDPWHQLAEAVQYLRKGGTVVISLPNIRHVTALLSIFLCGTFPRRSRGIFDGTHLRWFTFSDAMKLLEEPGLTMTAMDPALRVRDKGGGLLNRIAIRILTPIQRTYLVREFFSYQFCIQAVKS